MRSSLEPLLFSVLVAGFSGAIFALHTFHFVVQPLRPRWKDWRRESKIEALSSKFLSELTDLVTQFEELVSTSRQNGIHVAMQLFRFPSLPHIPIQKERSIEERLMQTLLGYHQQFIERLVNQMKSDLKNMKDGNKTFLFFHFAYILFDLVWIYASIFVEWPRSDM